MEMVDIDRIFLDFSWMYFPISTQTYFVCILARGEMTPTLMDVFHTK